MQIVDNISIYSKILFCALLAAVSRSICLIELCLKFYLSNYDVFFFYYFRIMTQLI
jgi:hypothetical protein